MLTYAPSDAAVLHVFPMYGHWQATDYVFALPVPPGISISATYAAAVLADLEMVVARDVVFAAIYSPEFQSQFADVIVHPQPFALGWCESCEDERYFVDTSRHPAEPAGARRCDVCRLPA